MQKISALIGYPLHGLVATRYIEQQASAALPANTLMQRAGLAVARLALALAPHAQRIWIACGPGNNGGDGIEAALHLQQWGKQPLVSWLGQPDSAPADTAAAYQRFQQAGLSIAPAPTSGFDLAIDALLGIGARQREPLGLMADWIQRLNTGGVPVLSVDIPSGLAADNGQATALHVRASHTLSLLTLKPGLFTADGRDASGNVWLDPLGLDMDQLQDIAPLARLPGAPEPVLRLHASHKGSYGDVAVLGGARGMTGAALLASSAALHAGAGRVFVSLLDTEALAINVQQPELMFRALDKLDLSQLTLVCGCGGGDAVRAILPQVLASTASLVLDADALNAIAQDPALQAALTARSAGKAATVLTPHPLEAARLLGLTAREVQSDRLAAAQTLARRFACVVVLKGSGTVIAQPGQIPVINPTGNGRLGTAGTGDVLAGQLGAGLAAGLPAFEAAWQAVYRHGAWADNWPEAEPLTAGLLARK